MASGDDAESLDDLIGRVDPDRWLTSRFIADAAARADVLALYAYDHELARVRRAASTPLLAEIRLTWWREVLDQMFAGEPVRRHPVAQAVANAVEQRKLERAPLEAMIDGQIAALDHETLSAEQALAWADSVEGAVARLAARILDPTTAVGAAAAAGRAWGLALVIRAGLATRETLAEASTAALAEARSEAKELSVAAMPAALPARLARYDLAGVQPGRLRKQLALVIAAATGSV